MTADRSTETGPVPAPESTHAPGPVFRDRGVIIATLTARVARVEALADEWDAAVDARGGSTLAPVRFLARDLRAALAGAPAVTPTETQAEDLFEFRNGISTRPAPMADPTTGETR